ncbi:hypothetical protein [Leptolyngbya sp. FACHB-17]|uniref:hypothetical protein n=1 Tax=unclassified Leptolyngbya TaxID=2650499 RepID=UPI001680E9A0|nr:hypothetical protein [Leptolyngbya sp. FACHB-17]MBD2079591.1 hypothetical protein [Leptolyngbya sp. FACHB-17]
MNIVTKKVVTRSLLGLAIALGCIVDNSRILKFQAEMNERSTAKAEAQAAQTSEETRLTKAQADSKTALDRAKSGCILVVLTRNNRPARFQEGARVWDAQTFPSNPKIPRFDKNKNPINGVQPMPAGVIVCNQFGDTAIVSEGGWLNEIRRIEPSKLQEFRSYLR